MYLDGYITKNQFIQAIKESFDKKIYPPKVNIKAPWFVFYVLEKLNKKYGEDVIAKA
jgi:membrane carboxypeptidase/penicillin-binding protein